MELKLNNNNDIFIDDVYKYINLLEGYKTRIKNLHWSSSNINMHTKLDELLDIVTDYQDNLAEEVMGIFGKFNSFMLRGTECIIINPNILIVDIINSTNVFYKTISEDAIFAGIKSELETFIHVLNKYNYLLSLCK